MCVGAHGETVGRRPRWFCCGFGEGRLERVESFRTTTVRARDYVYSGYHLHSSLTLQHFLQLATLGRLLGLVVASEMLSLDEHVGNGCLTRQFEEGGLNVGTVVPEIEIVDSVINLHVSE